MSPKMRISSKSTGGFALVAALSLLAFTTILFITLAALAQTESANAAHEMRMQKARSNAKLALMVALGELQMHAGPDQRVTATASILDTDPETTQIEGVSNAHWVGVWRTDGLREEAADSPLIEYSEGPMRDRRSETGLYERSAETLKWLVSGDNPDPTRPTADAVNIFGASTEAMPEQDKVFVDKVSISSASGNYAYWVSDEGTKAKLNLQKTDPASSPRFSDPESYHPVRSPDSFGLDRIFPSFNSIDSDDLEKLFTKQQLAVSSGLGTPSVGGSLAEAAQLLYHDLTTSSYSVLSDPLNGGLKRNLTAFLNSNGTVDPYFSLSGISDDTPILADASARDLIGPKYGAIRDWYRLGAETSGSLEDRVIDMTFPNLTSGPVTDPNNPDSDNVTDIANFTRQAVQPVMIEAAYQTNYTYRTDTREFYELTYPRVILWNPYNVKLRTPRMYVVFDYRVEDRVRFYYDYENSAGEIVNGYSTISRYFLWNGHWDKRLAYCIPETTFEPGECLLFTTAETGESTLHDRAHQFSESTINENLLSATADPADLRCFYRVAGSPVPSGDMSTLELRYDRTLMWNNDNPTQSVYLYAARDTSANPTRADLGSASFPAVQKYYMDNYSRGNNGRWLPAYNPPEAPGEHLPIDLFLTSGEAPYSLSGYGMRWKQFYESYSNRAYGIPLREPWYISPIMHHNVRARNIHRWPSDNIFGMRYTGAGSGTGAETSTSGARAHLYSYGPLGQTRQFPEWSDLVNSVTLTGSKFRTGPFFNTQDADQISVYPLFDIPDQDVGVHSMGALQHVQFTPHVWHPSYVVGNGFASPHISPESTGLSKAEEIDLWQQKVTRLYVGNNNSVHRMHEIGDDNMIFDISYETNFHLWDKYFLSSVPHDTSADGWQANNRWNLQQALPNSRMHIREDVQAAAEYDRLTDYYQAAKYLMLSGGFNINSTSKTAWEALLRSMNNLELPTRGGDSSPAQFSRFIVPQAQSDAAELATDRDLWAAYRNLSEEEISNLADEIVVQVKKRAPFIGLSDFVNRRLGAPDGNNDELHFFGALQAAINRSGINDNLDENGPDHSSDDFNLPRSTEAVTDYDYSERWDGVGVPAAQEYRSFEYAAEDGGQTRRLSEAIGAPGHLSQADILQQVGSVLTARSDTFTIRTYGDVTDQSTDQVVAQAWCEAVVQRLPEPLVPDPGSGNLNPIETVPDQFGRKFVVVEFRWLEEKEI